MMDQGWGIGDGTRGPAENEWGAGSRWVESKRLERQRQGGRKAAAWAQPQGHLGVATTLRSRTRSKRGRSRSMGWELPTPLPTRWRGWKSDMPTTCLSNKVPSSACIHHSHCSEEGQSKKIYGTSTEGGAQPEGDRECRFEQSSRDVGKYS